MFESLPGRLSIFLHRGGRDAGRLAQRFSLLNDGPEKRNGVRRCNSNRDFGRVVYRFQHCVANQRRND